MLDKLCWVHAVGFDIIEQKNIILHIQPKDCVILQCTGLEDRNGIDIYEADIVKFHYFYGALGPGDGFVECEHELTGILKWGEFGWALENIKGEHWKGYTGYEHGEGGAYLVELAAMNESALHEESFEVIGNIYETPLITQQP